MNDCERLKRLLAEQTEIADAFRAANSEIVKHRLEELQSTQQALTNVIADRNKLVATLERVRRLADPTWLENTPMSAHHRYFVDRDELRDALRSE